MELVTRFLVFRRLREHPDPDIENDPALTKVGDIGDFLNDHLERLDALRKASGPDEEAAFRDTFKYIVKNLEDNAFRRFDKAKQRFMGGFSISAFEVVAFGIGFNVDHIAKIAKPREKVQKL